MHNYWNANGSFGRLLSRAVGLQNHGRQVYAWDVWLLYGPGARWDSSEAPRPQLLMHQLSALRGSAFPYLDSHAFAARVRDLLARIPPESAAQGFAAQAHP